MRSFDAFAVIDWSGAKSRWHKGIAIAVCETGIAAPVLVAPPERHWTRQAVLDWLLMQADIRRNILIGLDLSTALPFQDKVAYFPGWSKTPADAKALWRLVDTMSHLDEHLSATSFIQHPEIARHFRQQRNCGDLFGSGGGRLRHCEASGQRKIEGINPYSCFNLVGAAQVGKSSLTGMRVLHQLAGAIPVWPFDKVHTTGPLILEIYTSIAARASGVLPGGKSKITEDRLLDVALSKFQTTPHTPLAAYNDHATDAILTAAWLRLHATNPAYWSPPSLTPEIAETEGWTFGVV